MRKLFVLVTIFGLMEWVSGSDKMYNDIKGIVRDSKSGEALPYANITIKGTHRGTTTNTDGYFVLVNEPVGLCTLFVQYIGYNTKTVPVENRTGEDQTLQIKLNQTVIDMEGVSITAAAEMLDVSVKQVSQMTIAPAQLTRLPNIGEVDVFRSIQLLPGISGANDSESGLYVRGGTPDQNLVLFDGMTIYHVDHFFGFFSAFNADAIKDIQVYKGGFPADYGGRISSVVDLTGKTGHQSKKQIGLGINLLSAHGYFEIPLGTFGNFLIAGRRSYTDMIRSPLYNSIYKLMTGEESGTMGPGVSGGPRMGNMQMAEFQPAFYFYDLNAKLTLNPSVRDVVAFSFYSGKDNLDKSQDYSGMPMRFGGSTDTENTATIETTDINRWGNFGVSGKWSRQWGSRFHTDVLTAYSKYFSEYDRDRDMDVSFVVPQGVTDTTDTGRRFMASASTEDNTVQDLTGRFDVTWNLAKSHTIKSGVWLSMFQSNYTYTMNDTISILDREDEALLSAVYLQDNWKIGANELTLGLRSSYFDGTDEWSIEPRVSFSIAFFSRFNFKGAWGKYSQFVNRIVNENVIEGSRDFWILADNNLKPTTSEHRILGLAYEMPAWFFSVEGYYKTMDNLLEFSRRYTGRADYSDYFFLGNGIAKGIEFLIQKKRGTLTGWVGYTLGRVEHTFPAFNNGEPFPAEHDRRHEVNAVAKYALGVWTFSATGVYATGRAYTAPESQYTLEMLDGEVYSYIHVGDKNSCRLPEYFRFDVSVSRLFESENWRTEVGVSVFNLTNHKNVWYREYNLDTTPVTVTDALMLGFTPTVYVQFNLK